MSTEFPPDIIQTATVAIFTPDLRSIVVVVNERLGMIVPPGWKMEATDEDIFATALREVWEEIWLVLDYNIWNFLDRHGNVVSTPEIAYIRDFIFPYNGSRGEDHLYFFLLNKSIHPDFLKAEKQWIYYTKSEVMKREVIILWKTYRVFNDDMKLHILPIMQD